MYGTSVEEKDLPFFLPFLEGCSLKILSGLPEVASRSAAFKKNNHSKFLVVTILSRDGNKENHQNLYSAPVKEWRSQGQSSPCYVWFLMQYFMTTWPLQNDYIWMVKFPFPGKFVLLPLLYVILTVMCRPSITFGTRPVNLCVSLSPRSQFYLFTACSKLLN